MEDIKNTWGKITEYSHGDEIYSVVWDVNVRVISDGEKINYDGKNNYMEVLNSSEISKVIETNHGKIRSKGRGGRDLKNDNPMSHEFGHFLGLKDKYIKSEDGKYSYIIPEWKGDIMAEPCYKTDRKISQYTLMHLLLNPIKYHQDRSRFVNFWTSLFNINYQISTTYKINKHNRQK